MGIGFDGVLVLLVLASVIALLAFTRIAADAVLVAALGVLLVAPSRDEDGWTLGGLISAPDAMSGFANTGMLTVGVLFIVVTGLRDTGGVDWIAQKLLGRPKGLRPAMVRVTLPVVGMSAFMNNTPVVAMLIPAVRDWAAKLGFTPSKLMIPLSYAAIVGGTCSLIGTSTNLVVAGLVVAQAPELDAIGMFDITWVGLPVTIVALAFLLAFGPLLLPSRRSAATMLADPREYTLEMMVPEASPLAGKSVEAAGLRSLPGGFLVEIQRGGESDGDPVEIISAIGPEQVLREGDRLLFAGVVESIKDLQNLRGLAPATDQVFKLDAPRYRRRLFEAVVSSACPIVGKTIREGRFRNRYQGAVIAVARNGERIRKKIGDIELRQGDVLLIEADPEFADRRRNSRDFLLVSALDDSTPRRHAKAPISLGILLVMVLLATFEVYPMLVAAMLAAGAMVITRCCTISSARRSVDWSVLIVIGAALGIGQAMHQTGAAAWVAQGVLSLAGPNPWLVLAGVYFVTSLMTETITNNAAVALSFPIAHEAALELGVDFMPFVIAIMVAGSASFATPLGYQTNLMVYGPGGYSFGDFLRIGIPMNVLVGVTAVLITPLVFPF